MSPTMLSQIETWINESDILNENQALGFIAFLQSNKFVQGTFIYPGAIMRKVNISAEKTYALLEMLKEKGILCENFELYCHECERFHHGVYDYYGDIPEFVECEGCFKPLNRAKSVIVIYKVIKDDK